MNIPNPQKKVDDDWKDKVESEGQKENPSKEAPTQAATEAPKDEEGKQGVPEVNFPLFVSTLAMQAYIALGELPEPATQQKSVNLPQAKYMIDLMTLIQEKTKNNLSPDEDNMLASVLHELRVKFVDKQKEA